MRLFGTLLPWIGWRELTPEVVETLAEYWDDIDPTHRYSAFSVEWLGYGRAWDIQSKGPRQEL